MIITISSKNDIPIYEQIKRQIKSAILSGDLQENELLPSLRKLSKELKVGVLTVKRAYTELEQEGFIKIAQGRGCLVAGNSSKLIREQLLCKVNISLSDAINTAQMANLSTQELHHILDILLNERTR